MNEVLKSPEVDRIYVIADGHSFTNTSKKLYIHRVWQPDQPSSLLRVVTRILKLRPDIVHFNLHLAVFGRGRVSNFLGFCLPLISRLLGFTTVVTLHNFAERIDLTKAGLTHSLVNRIGLLIATKLATLSNIMVVTMNSYVSLVRKKYRRGAIWIPHGAWNEKVAELKEDAGLQNVLFLGYLGPYKDLELLVDSYAVAKPYLNGGKLVVGGSPHPNYPDTLRDGWPLLTREGVNWVGYVPDELLPDVMKDVAVVALPYSTCTGTSGILHRVAGFGVPVVATDLPEFREMVSDGAFLMLAAPQPKEFGGAIISAISDPGLRLAARTANTRFATNRSWSRVGEMYLQVYKRALNI